MKIGAEAKAVLEKGYGPLARFIIDDVESVEEYLKENPHMINATGPEVLGAKSPLELSCHFGRMDIAKLLANMGANLKDLNQSRNIFWSAIFSESENVDLVKWLLSSGADPNSGSEPSFYTAAFLNKTDIMDILLPSSDVNVVVEGTPALIAACLPINFNAGFMEKPQESVLNSVKYLIEKKADVSARDGNGATALLVAAKLHYDLVANLLLDAGADKDAKMNDGSTLQDIATKEFLSKLKFK